MRNKTLLRVVQVLGFLSTVALLPSAQAVNVTISFPDCASGQTLGFNATTNTLSCSGTPPPSVTTPGGCSITASPSSSSGNGLTAGTQVSLTALCTTGTTPITYSWNIGVIGASLTVAPGTTTTYSVTPQNSSGFGSVFSTTVYIGTTPQQTIPPSNCNVSQSPNTNAAAVASGTTVTLSASCSGGDPVTSCSWTGVQSSACSVNVAPTSTTSYSMTASNGGGSAPAVGATVNITGVPPPNQPTNYCTGSDSVINVGWPASGQVRPGTSGFGNQKIAFKITIPSTFSPALNINHLGFMRIAETPGTTVTTRELTVSFSPCDFQSGNYLYSDIGFGDTSPGAIFTVNNPFGYISAGGTFNLNSGDIVYLNVRNANNGVPSCPYASCDILFDFATPNRY